MTSSPSASSQAPGQTTPAVFLSYPSAGLFTVKHSEQVRTEAVNPSTSIVTYLVEGEVTQSLPASEQKIFQMKVQKGEGLAGEQLRLQDWFPTEAGRRCVLGFNPQRLGNARNVQPLTTGSEIEQTWSDCERFYRCLPDGQKVDLELATAAIAEEPPPHAAFFQLLFRRDPDVCKDPDVCRALGAYLSQPQVPALERRKTVAHFMRRPECKDREARGELATGMLRVAVHLGAEGQTASAGVVFTRLDGFFGDSAGGQYSIDPPKLDDKERKAVEGLLVAPKAGVNRATQDGVRKWISGGEK
jgi:hypothetical protein